MGFGEGGIAFECFEELDACDVVFVLCEHVVGEEESVLSAGGVEGDGAFVVVAGAVEFFE